ncbi:MAG: twin-arginine translocase TatA/TatE family subunit [Planctomycetes bacterium]|nr:twin-arginine translocase TatA/TatE family subunit [Planctomycetota bacterium]
MIAFGLPGGWEWIAILVVVLLLFGHRLPGMARSLGSGITEFKRGLKEGSKDDAERGDGKTPATRDEPNSPKADSSKV